MTNLLTKENIPLRSLRPYSICARLKLELTTPTDLQGHAKIVHQIEELFNLPIIKFLSAKSYVADERLRRLYLKEVDD